MKRDGANVEIFPDQASLTRAAASRFVQDAREAIGARGRFAVALAGGATPRPVYETLASPGFRRMVDWSRVHVFWGDERCVPPDHVQSNYRMARETLLDPVAIPDENVHRIPGEVEPEAAASAYEQFLRTFFEPAGPGSGAPATFDLVLLGLGTDGHTASLFPRSPAIVEPVRWVRAQYVKEASMWRVTLTPVVLNLARDVVLLAAGESKAARVKDALEGPPVPETLPVQAINATRGRLSWLIDRAAAALLTSHTAA